MTPSLVAALIVGAALAAAAQVLLKIGATGRFDLLALINPYIVAGLGLFAAGVLLWLYAMARLPLSVVYPFNLVTLGLVFISSIAILGERPTTMTVAGWVVIACGIVVVAMGSRSIG